MKVQSIFNKIVTVFKNTVLCIKYPFLYPRNRWTGRGFNWWWLDKKINHLNKESTVMVILSVQKASQFNDESDDLFAYSYEEDGTCIIPLVNDKKYILNCYDIVENLSSIKRILVKRNISNRTYTIIMVVDDNEKRKEYIRYVTVVTNKFKKTLSNIACNVQELIGYLSFFWIEYTEIDVLKEMKGWWDAFGEQMLVDIKKQLKKDGMLYSWRILQLKEKWGRMELYCNYGSRELYDIIEKYSRLSSTLCIDCGKPAKYMSKGYILPFCEDCIDKAKIERYTKIGVYEEE